MYDSALTTVQQQQAIEQGLLTKYFAAPEQGSLPLLGVFPAPGIAARRLRA